MEFKNYLVRDVWAIVKAFIDAYTRYESALKDVQSNRDLNHAGPAYQKRIEEVQATKPDIFATVLQVEEVRSRMHSEIQGFKDQALDGSRISPDYAMLGLPVVLTADELIKLNLRNPFDPLFTRALKEYWSKHDTTSAPLAVVDYVEDRLLAYDSICRAAINIINHGGDCGLFGVDAVLQDFITSAANIPHNAELLLTNPQRTVIIATAGGR
jgi:hypothetical protein